MSNELDIFRNLRDRLAMGEFAFGSRLRAEVLKSDFDCSASTLREILFRLASIGLVEFREQRGFRVPLASPELRHDLTDARIFLECEGAARSLRRGGIDWEAGLSAAHHRLKHIETKISATGEGVDMFQHWLKAEKGFHEALMSDCGSETLKELHSIVYARVRQQQSNEDRSFVHVAENINQHQAIVDAAIEGDETKVRDRIYAHLSRGLLPEDEVA